MRAYEGIEKGRVEGGRVKKYIVRKKLGKGQAWGKNCNNIFVPTALTIIGK